MGSFRFAARLLTFALAVLSVPAGQAEGPAPAALPGTPQGRHAAAFLAALKDGSPDALRTMAAEHYAASALEKMAPDARAKRMWGMVSDLGALELRRVFPGAGATLSVLAESAKTGEMLRLEFDFEPAPPNKLLGVRIQPADGPGSGEPPEPPKSSDAAVASAAEDLLAKMAAADAFSGVALIARDAQPFFQKAYGLANRDLGVPNRLDTKFNLGSINKVFTHIAIAQLVEKGELALSDTIQMHLPDAHITAADRITVQQLLSMTSGLGDFFGEKYQATPKNRLRKLSDFLPLFAEAPLKFEPGKGRGYSNAGYVVLGLIIERVSGQEYWDYLAKNVFGPAGMKDTGGFDEDAVVPNRAVGYTRRLGPDGVKRNNFYSLPGRSSSAGGGYSTAGDLLKLDRALRNDALLSPAMTQWLFGEPDQAPQPSTAKVKHMGGYGYAGGSPGVNAAWEGDIDRGFTVIVLANEDPQVAEDVARKLRAWLKR